MARCWLCGRGAGRGRAPALIPPAPGNEKSGKHDQHTAGAQEPGKARTPAGFWQRGRIPSRIVHNGPSAFAHHQHTGTRGICMPPLFPGCRTARCSVGAQAIEMNLSFRRSLRQRIMDSDAEPRLAHTTRWSLQSGPLTSRSDKCSLIPPRRGNRAASKPHCCHSMRT